ncbi:hypothetical protein V6N13_099905 [Hibiscus sabdariffa]
MQRIERQTRIGNTKPPKGNKSLGTANGTTGALRIIEHDIGIQSGNHRAVSVIEHEDHDRSRNARDGQRKRSLLGKGNVDVSRTKLLLRRNPSGRNAGTVPIADFTHRLTSDLDMIQAYNIPSGSRGNENLHNFEPMLQSSDDEEFDRSDSPEVLPGGLFLKTTKRRANRISALQREDGSWFSEAFELKNLAKDFYQNLFTSSLVSPLPTAPHDGFPIMKNRTRTILLAPVSMEEVSHAIFSIGASKARGVMV